ncbi:MAG TPA: hypothetical protein VFF50_05830 [Candidatus Deferrimicrobiaceae bacterium]|nr:hypothetical protein [Candidatus Deferrimicrobiaceae bacterium]
MSKNTLSGIRFYTVKDKSGREGTPQLAQAVKGTLPTLIAANVERAGTSDPNLDPVPFFQFKRLNHCGGQAYGQAVSPL